MRKIVIPILLLLMLITACKTEVPDKAAPSHYIVEYKGDTDNYYVTTRIENEVQDEKIVSGNVSVSAIMGSLFPTSVADASFRGGSCMGVYLPGEEYSDICWKASCKHGWKRYIINEKKKIIEGVEDEMIIEKKEILAPCSRWPPKLYQEVTQKVDDILENAIGKIERGEEPFQPGSFGNYYFPDADTDEVIQIFGRKEGCNPGLCYQGGYLRWFNYGDRDGRARYSYNVIILAE